MKKIYDFGFRNSERINCRLDASYSLAGRGRFKSETRNISAGGVLLSIGEGIKKDDLLDMEIRIDSKKQPIKVVGRVVHVREEKTEEGHSRGDRCGDLDLFS